MSEEEKQLNGLPYDAADPAIRQLQNAGKTKMLAYNAIPPTDTEARRRALEEMLAACGQDSHINQPFWFDFGCHISIGDHSIVNLNCTFLDTGLIHIGSFTLIGPDVKIYTASHPLASADRYRYRADGSPFLITTTKPVTIGDGVWIGGGTIVLPGVTIGDHAVIGAGSVVTKNIPPYAIACGHPCTVKKWQLPPGRENSTLQK